MDKTEVKSKRGVKQGDKVQTYMGQSINQNFSFDVLSRIYLIGHISGHNEKAVGEGSSYSQCIWCIYSSCQVYISGIESQRTRAVILSQKPFCPAPPQGLLAMSRDTFFFKILFTHLREREHKQE